MKCSVWAYRQSRDVSMQCSVWAYGQNRDVLLPRKFNMSVEFTSVDMKLGMSVKLAPKFDSRFSSSLLSLLQRLRLTAVIN